MKQETADNLKRLVARIDELLAGANLELGEPHALEQILDTLRQEEGARVYQNPDYAMTLAGVRSSCTSGWHGLLRNWQNTARRRIEREGVSA